MRISDWSSDVCSSDLVPGVTAGIGGLAYAGIPTTHRDTNSAVTFVTGHGLGGDVPDNLDWTALAKGSPVLVFYMALKHLPEIVARLRAAGRDGARSEEHTSELQSLMRISYAVFCLKKKNMQAWTKKPVEHDHSKIRT